MYGLSVTGQLFLNFTQWNLLIPPIFSLPLSLPPETTKCIKSQRPQKPRGSLLVLSRRNLYEEQIKFTFWNGQTTQQPNQGKQKTKYSNSSKYFCYNTITGLLLAINVSLSFSSPAQIYSESRSGGCPVFKQHLSATWALPKSTPAPHPLSTRIKQTTRAGSSSSPPKQPLLNDPRPFIVKACDERYLHQLFLITSQTGANDSATQLFFKESSLLDNEHTE